MGRAFSPGFFSPLKVELLVQCSHYNTNTSTARGVAYDSFSHSNVHFTAVESLIQTEKLSLITILYLQRHSYQYQRTLTALGRCSAFVTCHAALVTLHVHAFPPHNSARANMFPPLFLLLLGVTSTSLVEEYFDAVAKFSENGDQLLTSNPEYLKAHFLSFKNYKSTVSGVKT